MDYAAFIKKIKLPDDFAMPQKLAFEDIMARPLTRSDLTADLDAVNSSIEVIQKTRGGSWPQEELSEDFDLLDLAWHEREFRDGNSFAYVVYDTSGVYIGCFYLYGLGTRTQLTKELIDFDIDASWWVTAKAYEQGYYPKLYRALLQWLQNDLPLGRVYYSDKDIPNTPPISNAS